MKKILVIACATVTLWAALAYTTTSTATSALHNSIAHRDAQIEELTK